MPMNSHGPGGMGGPGGGPSRGGAGGPGGGPSRGGMGGPGGGRPSTPNRGGMGGPGMNARPATPRPQPRPVTPPRPQPVPPRRPIVRPVPVPPPVRTETVYVERPVTTPVTPTPVQLYCAYCNGLIPDDAYECPHCGAPVLKE